MHLILNFIIAFDIIYMKQIVLTLSFFIFSNQIAIPQAAAGYETIADTIEIHGKFPDICSKPPFVFITRYDNSAGEVGRVISSS